MLRGAALAGAIVLVSSVFTIGCNDLTKPNEMKVVKEAPKPKPQPPSTGATAVAAATQAQPAARPTVPCLLYNLTLPTNREV